MPMHNVGEWGGRETRVDRDKAIRQSRTRTQWSLEAQNRIVGLNVVVLCPLKARWDKMKIGCDSRMRN